MLDTNAVQNLRAEVKGDLFSSLHPDTLFFDRNLDTFVTFGFLDNSDVGVADSNIPHQTLLYSIFDEPQVLTWESEQPKEHTTELFKISGRTAMYWYQSRSIARVDLPVITFWQKWHLCKPYIDRAIKLSRKLNPDLPPPGPLWYVGTMDKVGWYDDLTTTKSSKEREELARIQQMMHMADPMTKRAMQRPEDKPKMKTMDLDLRQKLVLGDSTKQSESELLAECYNQVINRN